MRRGVAVALRPAEPFCRRAAKTDCVPIHMWPPVYLQARIVSTHPPLGVDRQQIVSSYSHPLHRSRFTRYRRSTHSTDSVCPPSRPEKVEGEEHERKAIVCAGDIEHALVPLPALRCAPPRSAGAGLPYSRHPAAAAVRRGLSGYTIPDVYYYGDRHRIAAADITAAATEPGHLVFGIVSRWG